MAQFLVYHNPRGSRDRIAYLLDVQSNVVDIGSRLVVPLILQKDFGTRLSRMNPVFIVSRRKVIMATSDLAGVSAKLLLNPVADLSSDRDEILSAIDFLLTGY